MLNEDLEDFNTFFLNHFAINTLLNDIEKYHSLWKAVILQAITDSISNNKRTEMQLEKQKSISWLLEFNQDFDVVCKYANYEPTYIQNKARSIITKHKLF